MNATMSESGHESVNEITSDTETSSWQLFHHHVILILS
jgi:hypothetical protein